jgi:hypothetical protein
MLGESTAVRAMPSKLITLNLMRQKPAKQPPQNGQYQLFITVEQLM